MRVFAAICAIAAGLFVVAPSTAADLKVGDDAPDFKLEGSDGKTYKLSDFKGKQAVVVGLVSQGLHRRMHQGMQVVQGGRQETAGVQHRLLASSTDTAEKNEDFAKSLDVDYPILSDPDGKTATAYGIFNAEKD